MSAKFRTIKATKKRDFAATKASYVLIGPPLQKKKTVILPADKRTSKDIDDLNKDEEEENKDEGEGEGEGEGDSGGRGRDRGRGTK